MHNWFKLYIDKIYICIGSIRNRRIDKEICHFQLSANEEIPCVPKVTTKINVICFWEYMINATKNNDKHTSQEWGLWIYFNMATVIYHYQLKVIKNRKKHWLWILWLWSVQCLISESSDFPLSKVVLEHIHQPF